MCRSLCYDKPGSRLIWIATLSATLQGKIPKQIHCFPWQPKSKSLGTKYDPLSVLADALSYMIKWMIWLVHSSYLVMLVQHTLLPTWWHHYISWCQSLMTLLPGFTLFFFLWERNAKTNNIFIFLFCYGQYLCSIFKIVRILLHPPSVNMTDPVPVFFLSVLQTLQSVLHAWWGPRRGWDSTLLGTNTFESFGNSEPNVEYSPPLNWRGQKFYFTTQICNLLIGK